ncbi:MAG TPA: SPFH domain-containing protein [Verrucomicrobiales bacterium]|jgi:regulator of protease activity HflC (stomatin/prohibitin superfamily)|nr:SPFH domain-containing protein [Verrucomicrobiales bacterium]
MSTALIIFAEASAVQVILILVIVTILVFALLGLKIVRHSETIVIERLGRYHRTLASGINIIWPIIDRARAIHWRYTESGPNGRVIFVTRSSARIDLRETVYDFPRQNVITKDNVQILINALVYFQITDPMKSVYEISNLPDAIEKLTQTTLRNVIGELDFDQCLVSRDTVNKKLGLILDDATHKWGVKVNRVELQDITPPADVQQAMEKQMRAERDRRAQILAAEGSKGAAVLEAEGIRQAAITTAEGAKQSAILRAEGDAQAMERIAQAQAEAIRRVREGLSGTDTDAAAYLIAARYMDTLKEMTSGKDNKVVYVPYEATGVLGALGSIKNLFENNGVPPTTKPPQA